MTSLIFNKTYTNTCIDISTKILFTLNEDFNSCCNFLTKYDKNIILNFKYIDN